MSYTSRKAAKTAWRTVPSGLSATRFFLTLVMALPALLVLGASRKKSSALGPLGDGILGLALGLTVTSLFITPVVFFAHSLHGHHRGLGFGLLAVGVISALVFAGLLRARPS